jgi:hypothetical protein
VSTLGDGGAVGSEVDDAVCETRGGGIAYPRNPGRCGALCDGIVTASLAVADAPVADALAAATGAPALPPSPRTPLGGDDGTATVTACERTISAAAGAVACAPPPPGDVAAAEKRHVPPELPPCRGDCTPNVTPRGGTMIASRAHICLLACSSTFAGGV